MTNLQKAGEETHEEEGHEEEEGGHGHSGFPWVPVITIASFLIVLFIDRVVFDSHSSHGHGHDHEHQKKDDHKKKEDN